MLALKQGTHRAAKPAPKSGWLAALETELKRRIGWTDEAVSPFARKRKHRITRAA